MKAINISRFASGLFFLGVPGVLGNEKSFSFYRRPSAFIGG